MLFSLCISDIKPDNLLLDCKGTIVNHVYIFVKIHIVNCCVVFRVFCVIYKGLYSFIQMSCQVQIGCKGRMHENSTSWALVKFQQNLLLSGYFILIK